MVVRDHGSTELKTKLSLRARRKKKALTEEAHADRLVGRMHNRVLPKLRLEMRDPRSLRDPEINVKVDTLAQVARVGAAIDSLDYVHPLLITPSGVIVDGVSTKEAAIRLGMAEVPVLVGPDWTDPQAIAVRLAINVLPMRSALDPDKLKIAVATAIAADINLDFVFEAPVIDLIMAGDHTTLDKRANALPPESAIHGAISEPGNLWELGPHRVLQGDARDASAHTKLMGGTMAQMVCQDPPYNIGGDIVPGLRSNRQGAFAMANGELSDNAFTVFLTESIATAADQLVNGGLVFSFMDYRHIRHLIDAAEAAGLTFLNMAVWVKSQGGMGVLYRSQHEFIGIFKKGDAPYVNNVELGKHGRDRTNIWNYPGATTRGSSASKALGDHPTPKSVEMIADAILDVTHRGDIVLDPFLGSGTTIIAAHKVGRIAYGMELDSKYVEVIIRRWETLTGIPAILRDTGETFAQVVDRKTAQDTPRSEEVAVQPERPRIRIAARGRTTPNQDLSDGSADDE